MIGIKGRMSEQNVPGIAFSSDLASSGIENI